MEREALAEELVNVKSRKTLEAVSGEEGTQSPTPSGKVSVCLCGWVGGRT